MSEPTEPDQYAWVEQTQTIDATDPAIKAVEANPSWHLLHVGAGSDGQTTLTYGWPWPTHKTFPRTLAACLRELGISGTSNAIEQIRGRAASHRRHANGPCTDPGFWRARASDLEWAASLIEEP
jgi:hypothetical protein